VIEVIAFEIGPADEAKNVKEPDQSEKVEAISKALNKYRVDLSNFKFDRDEANDYE